MKTTPPQWAIRTKADVEALPLCYWDQTKADAICRYAENLFRSQYIRGKFRLLDWQRKLLQSLYGWRMNEDGSRRFRFANLHCSKKNGKTLLTAIIACFELFCSERPSPFVCVAAASKENASQVFSELAYTIENGPLAEFSVVTKHTKKIEVPSLNGKLWTLASDGKRVHGYNPTICILDECHAMKDPELFRALRYATIASRGLCFLISTAGNNSTHWYYQTYTKSKKILSGEDLDITHYAEVHETDEKGDIEQPEQWAKACPSLGISYSVDDFKRELYAAKNGSVGDWLNFQQMLLNKWVRPSETAWLEVSNWHKQTKHISDEELTKYEAMGGVDLGETIAPASISLTFDLGDGNYFIKSKAWVAEDALIHREKTNLRKFEDFTDLQIEPGEMLRKELVLEQLEEWGKVYDIRKVNFDPRSAYILMNDCIRLGFDCERFQQKPRMFDAPMRCFEQLWKEGKIWHDGSDWLHYCFENVRLEVNRWSEIAPHTGSSVDHIDGAVAVLLGFIEFVKEDTSIHSGGGFL